MRTRYSKRQIEETIRFWERRLRRFDEATIQDMPYWKKGIERVTGVRPFGKQELDWIVGRLGTTENFQDTGWILPDGRMLDMGRTEESYWDKDGVQRDMSGREMIDSKRYEHECIPLPLDREHEVYDNHDIAPVFYLMAAGLVRIDGADSATVSCVKKPTPKQMDRLYDFVDQPWETMYDFYRHRKGITEFCADLGGKAIVYDDVDEFRKRLMNDIRNFCIGRLV